MKRRNRFGSEVKCKELRKFVYTEWAKGNRNTLEKTVRDFQIYLFDLSQCAFIRFVQCLR